jgi:RsiW-degrading membrane proteinase PrsW (M82 family)
MAPFSLVVGFLPVVLFLGGLMLMDSYKLVSRRSVLQAIGAGCLAAGLAFLANRAALDGLRLDPLLIKRYGAPLVEEVLKALFVFYLIRTHRVGFMVDAGIQGFAVGTGFALLENVYYAGALADFRPLVWVVRGLGTAIMHGSTTAIVGILAKDLTDRHASAALRWFLPGLLLAILVHSFFNHLVLDPLVTTCLLLIIMPLLLLLAFERSERATRAWLGRGIDSDVELLELISSDEIADSRVGRYLESLKSRFSGAVVADMLCLLRIYLELSLGAKGILLARSAGVRIPVDEHLRANFSELKYLEKSIGRTGKLAILPFMRTSSRDLWQLYMLEQ